MRLFARLILLLSAALLPLASAHAAPVQIPAGCQALPTSSTQQDYYVSDCRQAKSGTYTYQYLHVVAGGTIYFVDDGGTINLRAQSILVEQGGAMVAGSYDTPFGLNHGKLVIGLYGAGPQDFSKSSLPSYAPIQCQNKQCYPAARVGQGCYNSGMGFNPNDPCQAVLPADHHLDNTYFEGYGHDHGTADSSPFGYKVLAVSYGGSLQLFGAKGVAKANRTDPAVATASCPVPADGKQNDVLQWAALTGSSWARAGATAAASSSSIQLDRAVDWAQGDQIIVGTTDWSPSHSELASVTSASGASGGTTLALAQPLQYGHNGQVFAPAQSLLQASGNPNINVENRAAVGLLSRSIVIESLGAKADQPFPAASACGTSANNPDCYFGGHTMVRQGFAAFQVQGVEFHHLGQGGNLGRYPVHFHMVKDASYTNAFLKDSSIWESNTRFVTVHASHHIEVARNVGYLSMGHGFYVEDGSEINNLFCQNLGVSARAALIPYFASQTAGAPESRFIPPILDTMQDGTVQGSDASFPTMFWIMNAYNEFVGNQAVGVGGFGACYWPLSDTVSGPSTSLHWARSAADTPSYQTYSELDYANFNVAGARQAPFKRFRANSCSTAAYGLMTERASLQPEASAFSTAPSSGAPLTVQVASNPYKLSTSALPNVSSNFYGVAHAVSPDVNPTCAAGYPTGTPSTNGKYCVATVIDRFTTSFNWAQTNFGSVWLRPWSYLFVNGAITDQLFGGLGFVSGGSWDQELNRQLALVKNTIFVGSVSPTDPLAGQNGPAMASAVCSVSASGAVLPMPFCLFAKDGVGLYMGGFNPKRMITIYDGPFFSDGNVFTQIGLPAASSVKTQPGATPPYAAGTSIYDSTNQPATPLTSSAPTQYTTRDAAIGWKQPNGFYYPPVFAFRHSAFDKTAQRHNVLDQYAYYVNGQLWGAPIALQPSQMGATPIDSTTILNDLDGSLNGIVPAGGNGHRSSGLSNNTFYDAPFTAPQCNSFGTQTIPEDFVTTVVTQLSGQPEAASPAWTMPGWTNGTPAVAVYRQMLTGSAGEQCTATTQVCGNGQANCCRRGTMFMGAQIGAAPGLTMNQGLYYIDTDSTADAAGGAPAPFQVASFSGGSTYLLHHLYATSQTKVTYQIYVGTQYTPANGQWVRIDPHKHNPYGPGLQVTASPAALGSTSFDAATGVLTVTLDDSMAGDFGFASASAQSDACAPSNLCQVNKGKTGCTLNPAFKEIGLTGTVNEVCKFWSTRTSGQALDGVFLNDCPAGGCIGFSFTLPTGFVPQPYSTAGAGLATCFPNSAPWNSGFKVLDASCSPTPPSTGNFCAPPKPPARPGKVRLKATGLHSR
ncbi:MAG TPA: G8 domain-containing protein [Telluria sp.]|nr:G8 domain-containing protein [Telluria sp.]